MKINYESTSAERMYDEYLKEFIIQARLKLQEILKDNKQNGISWVAIPKNSDNRYLKVATLKRVLRDKFNHTLILKSDIKHDCEHRVIIEATLSDKRGNFLSSGLAERWKDPKSSNVQKQRAIECCQTAAWGRCIKSLLAVGNDISTADEIDRSIIISDINKEIDKEVL